jgi:hypothetical protein
MTNSLAAILARTRVLLEVHGWLFERHRCTSSDLQQTNTEGGEVCHTANNNTSVLSAPHRQLSVCNCTSWANITLHEDVRLNAAVPHRPADTHTHTTALLTHEHKNTPQLLVQLPRRLKRTHSLTSFVDSKLTASLTGVYTVVAATG